MNVNKIAGIIALALAPAVSGFGQVTNIHLISATIGDGGAIQIKWESESNAVYRIDYASTLINSNTHFQTLYQHYASHGTNTFWLDTGDYLQQPVVPHPSKAGMRVYRIVREGTNAIPG